MLTTQHYLIVRSGILLKVYRRMLLPCEWWHCFFKITTDPDCHATQKFVTS